MACDFGDAILNLKFLLKGHDLIFLSNNIRLNLETPFNRCYE